MSRIEKLIVQFCPDGVEFKELGQVGVFIRGSGLQKKDFVEKGVGCIHYGQIYTYYGTFTSNTISYVTPELARQLKKVNTGDLIIASTSENIEDVCKTVVWLGEEEIVTGGHATIFKHEQNPKYLAYLTQTQLFFDQKRKYAKGTKVIDVSAKDMAKISIPIPPLPIQHEIVSILDKFTALEAELEAELEARKKQYEYYRNELLNFEGKEVEWKTLGEICLNSSNINWEINKGRQFRYIDLSSVSRENSRIIETQSIDSSNAPSRARQIVLKDDVIFGTTRPTLKRFALIDQEYNNQICSTGFCVLRANQEILMPKFLYFILTTSVFFNYVENNQEGAGYPSISNSLVKKFRIPILPLTEQKIIVELLDKFETLVNNISVGLPAEIQARRKQYEYYRGKLLTFKPLQSN